MKRTTRRTSILVCGLVGVLVAGPTMAAAMRYIGSGNYNDFFCVTGTHGWQDWTCQLVLPGSNDVIRINWGNNTVTLTNVAPDVAGFQMGVDESGQLVVESGGSLTAVGASANVVGNNPNAGIVGRLTVKTKGVVNSAAVLEVGYNANGILTIDGGTVNVTNHLWVGCGTAVGVTGTINITNGGVLNIAVSSGGLGMLGLGTVNASTPSGGTGFINVNGGGVLNLYNISSTALGSIQPGSMLNISGSGVVTIPGNRVATMSAYTNAGRITAYGGTGAVLIDYDTVNPGKTTLTAIGGYVPPTDCTWIATSGAGLWSEPTNWSCGFRPVGVTKAIFNVPGTIPCIVNDSASADCIDMGTNGPGGTLIITNTGILTCVGTNANFIGYNSNALMVVENGGSASFNAQLRIGFDLGSDGTLIMNGGAVSVSGMFDLGYQGGKGTAQIKGGTLNLSQLHDYMFMQGASLLDVSGTGKVVINGDHQWAMNYYISTGQITNSSGAGLVVDYNLINVGKTTVYPSDLVLPPARVVWNPVANPSSTGLWNECANWTGGLCPGDVTAVTFDVLGAIPCTVTNAAIAGYVSMGDSGGPGGTLTITKGASLTTFANNWCAVGYSSNALMIVDGGSASFASHLWVGFGQGADGTLIIDGGTVEVWGMFGLGWLGGKGTVIITNGGNLIVHQWDPTDSIKGASVLNLTGTGTVVITGNYVTSISNFVYLGKITANGGPNVAYGYDSGANKTTLQVAPPRQSITSVAVSGGNTALSYETTAGHIYHLESTASLSPAAWTRVTGSTTTATGASVTFPFPASANPAFYRVVSP